jgi:co-chaperonin GroES (HSP10)
MSLNPVKISKLTPLKNYVIVSDMGFDTRVSSGGIVLLKDDMKSHGVRPRWARVYAVGPEQTDVHVGQWICVAHGRWTRGIEIEDLNGVQIIRRIDVKDILLVSDEPVVDDNINDSI